MSQLQVHFGDPSRPSGALRDVLAERVAKVPPGGAIDWVTYYFRDRRLAEELLKARRRGVVVRVTLDGHPRTPCANDRVIRMLRGHEGLAGGLRIVQGAMDSLPWGRLWRPRLHEKLYCFTEPEPVAFVGSFNPSGDEPEEQPDVVREIGDHDRGFNMLVELRQPAIVGSLIAHARRLHSGHHGPLSRFSPAANRALQNDDLAVHFWPRIRANPVVTLLRGLDQRSRLRIAASHVSGLTPVRTLLATARRGVKLEMLTEATKRRVPTGVERRLAADGISIRRVVHPVGLPMHDKFALVDHPGCRWVVFGSFNWSEPSRWLNREIGVISRDSNLYDALAERWKSLWASG